MIAGVERCERLAQVRSLSVRARAALELDACGEPVGREASRHAREQLQRVVVVASLVENPGQRDRRVRARGLELDGAPKRGLVTLGDEPVGF